MNSIINNAGYLTTVTSIQLQFLHTYLAFRGYAFPK